MQPGEVITDPTGQPLLPGLELQPNPGVKVGGDDSVRDHATYVTRNMLRCLLFCFDICLFLFIIELSCLLHHRLWKPAG